MKYTASIIWVIIFLGNPFITLKSQTTNVKLDEELSAIFKNSSIPGIAVAIVNQEKVLYKNEFGYADVAAKKPYTQNTIQNIGSTSKTFIGIAIMQLIEQGKLTLDTKINDVLPFEINNPYHPAIPITVRHLATHTSSIRDRSFNYGLRSYVSNDNVKGNRKGLPWMYKIQFKRMLKNKEYPLGEFLERTLSKKGKWYKKKNFYKNAPGTTENYSNIASGVAAYLVEIISGENYGDYVVNHILKPLNMEESGWTIETTNPTFFAKRYINEKAVPDYRLITYPDGGLISSAADLSTYLMAMIKGYKGESEILSAESFQEMMTNQYEQNPLSNSIQEVEGKSGVFWDIHGKKGKGDLGHTGSDPGILSFMYFDPLTGVGCLILTNTDSDDDNFKAVIKMWKALVKSRDSIN